MRQGAQSAGFEEFVRNYGERAFQFAFRLSGNTEEAKDLVQEAFCRALRNWEKYDPSQPLESWFFTILRHVFLDGRKRYERRHAVSLDGRPGVCEGGLGYHDLLPSQEEAVLETLERKENAGAVRAALDALTFEHKAVLTMCDMEGLSYEESARLLKVAVGTVRSRLSRARQALRACLAERLESKR